jgi:hypothetical protein
LPSFVAESGTVQVDPKRAAATDERTLRIGIAIFILLAAVALLAGLRLPTRARLPLMLSVGVVASGICNGAVAMGGLPVALFLTAESANPRALRASVIALLLLSRSFLKSTINAPVYSASFDS